MVDMQAVYKLPEVAKIAELLAVREELARQSKAITREIMRIANSNREYKSGNLIRAGKNVNFSKLL